MLSFKLTLLLLTVYFGAVFTASSTAWPSKKIEQQNYDWQRYVVPAKSTFLNTRLPTVDGRKVQTDIKNALYCKPVTGFWIIKQLEAICKKFANIQMDNKNIDWDYNLTTRRSFENIIRTLFIPQFGSYYISEESDATVPSPAVKQFHRQLREQLFYQELPPTQYPNLVLPKFVIPYIYTQSEINSGASVKPHLVLVSDYLNNGIQDTIYDEHPLKEVMEAIKQVKDQAKIKKFTVTVDEKLKNCTSWVEYDVLSDLSSFERYMLEYEQFLVSRAGEILDPSVKEKIIEHARSYKAKVEKEEDGHEAQEKAKEREAERAALVAEITNKLKLESEKKLQEAEAKSAKLQLEIQILKALLKEKDAEISSTKKAQQEAEKNLQVAETRANHLFEENAKLKRLLKERDSQPPVLVIQKPKQTTDSSNLSIYAFFAIIAILLLVSRIVFAMHRESRDIV